MIYLDNAATTLHKPKEVQEAVIAAFGQMGNSGRGASEPALKALGTVYDAREALARLFHAENAAFAFVCGSKTGEDLADAVTGEVHLLLRRDVLVAEEQHLVHGQGLAQLALGGGIERLAQVQVVDDGADGGGVGLHRKAGEGGVQVVDLGHGAAF